MLAIIIINYNKYEKTIECIESIRKTYNKEYKIYLLDNASTNDSQKVLQEKYSEDPQIKLILSDDNLGYARGNNLCLKMAVADGCKYAIVSNNDIVFKENAIECLYDRIKTGEYLAVGPCILKENGSVQNSVKLTKPRFHHYIWHETYLRSLLPKRSRTENAPTQSVDVYWLSGCLFMFDLVKFEPIGFFDPYTFLFFEEYIVSEKARNKGMKLQYCYEAKVIHCHGASMGGAVNMVTKKANWRSESYVMQKYFGWNYFRRLLVWWVRCLEAKYVLRHQEQKKEIFKDFYTAGKKYVRGVDE